MTVETYSTLSTCHSATDDTLLLFLPRGKLIKAANIFPELELCL